MSAAAQEVTVEKEVSEKDVYESIVKFTIADKLRYYPGFEESEKENIKTQFYAMYGEKIINKSNSPEQRFLGTRIQRIGWLIDECFILYFNKYYELIKKTNSEERDRLVQAAKLAQPHEPIYYDPSEPMPQRKPQSGGPSEQMLQIQSQIGGAKKKVSKKRSSKKRSSKKRSSKKRSSKKRSSKKRVSKKKASKKN